MADAITRAISGLADRVIAFRVIRGMIKQGNMDMDRLREKLALAAGVVQRQSTKIEARADSLIAREETIEQRTHQVFSPHEGMLAEAEKGLDGLEASLRLLSNDPLPNSGSSPEVEGARVDTFPGK